MNTLTDIEKVSLTGRVLGVLFYCSPTSQEAKNIIKSLLDGEGLKEWPDLDTDNRKAIIEQMILQNTQSESFEEAYQRLFIGPYALPAPPWGSVYLDRECVVFGESTINLRCWMRDNQIDIELDIKEPEDHVGLMFMMAAWLAENQPQLISIFLQDHFLPWVYRYLELQVQLADSPFYQALAKLSVLTLKNWQHDFGLKPKEMKLYR